MIPAPSCCLGFGFFPFDTGTVHPSLCLAQSDLEGINVAEFLHVQPDFGTTHTQVLLLAYHQSPEDHFLPDASESWGPGDVAHLLASASLRSSLAALFVLPE